jgi:hypothetical protein
MRLKTGDRSTLLFLKENDELWSQNDWPGVALGLKDDDGNLEYCVFFCENLEEWKAILPVFYAIRSRTDTSIYDFELLLPNMNWHPRSIFNLEPEPEDLQ